MDEEENPREIQAMEWQRLRSSINKKAESARWAEMIRAERIANHLPERLRAAMEAKP